MAAPYIFYYKVALKNCTFKHIHLIQTVKQFTNYTLEGQKTEWEIGKQ